MMDDPEFKKNLQALSSLNRILSQYFSEGRIMRFLHRKRRAELMVKHTALMKRLRELAPHHGGLDSGHGS